MDKSSPPRIFSASRQANKVLRARAINRPDADFLIKLAATAMADRLSVTRRDFPLCIDLFSPSARAAAALGECDNAGEFIVADQLSGAHMSAPSADLIADPDALPFKPQSLSLVASVFALHRSNDLPGVLNQIRHALKPDGLFLACLPGEQTLQELRQALITAESELSGAASMRVDPFGHVRQYGDLLQRAGFALPVADSETVTIRYADFHALIGDLRAMAATSAFTDSPRFPGRQLFERASQIYQEMFSDTDGRIRATLEIVYLSGWAPDQSQQKPLRPGSAKHALKDFL